MKRFLFLLPAFLAIQVSASPALAWTWPVEGPVIRQFQLGDDPYASGQHRGVDIQAPDGAGVRAPATGRVAFSGTVPSGGRTVTIETTAGYSVTLLHLGWVSVSKGDVVGEGSVIGNAGQSGVPEHDTAYVHLGVRITAEPHGYLDPLSFLPPRSTQAGAAPNPVEQTTGSTDAPPTDPETAQPGREASAAPATGSPVQPELSGQQTEVEVVGALPAAQPLLALPPEPAGVSSTVGSSQSTTSVLPATGLASAPADGESAISAVSGIPQYVAPSDIRADAVTVEISESSEGLPATSDGSLASGEPAPPPLSSSQSNGHEDGMSIGQVEPEESIDSTGSDPALAMVEAATDPVVHNAGHEAPAQGHTGAEHSGEAEDGVLVLQPVATVSASVTSAPPAELSSPTEAAADPPASTGQIDGDPGALTRAEPAPSDSASEAHVQPSKETAPAAASPSSAGGDLAGAKGADAPALGEAGVSGRNEASETSEPVHNVGRPSRLGSGEKGTRPPAAVGRVQSRGEVEALEPRAQRPENELVTASVIGLNGPSTARGLQSPVDARVDHAGGSGSGLFDRSESRRPGTPRAEKHPASWSSVPLSIAIVLAFGVGAAGTAALLVRRRRRGRDGELEAIGQAPSEGSRRMEPDLPELDEFERARLDEELAQILTARGSGNARQRKIGVVS